MPCLSYAFFSSTSSPRLQEETWRSRLKTFSAQLVFKFRKSPQLHDLVSTSEELKGAKFPPLFGTLPKAGVDQYARQARPWGPVVFEGRLLLCPLLQPDLLILLRIISRWKYSVWAWQRTHQLRRIFRHPRMLHCMPLDLSRPGAVTVSRQSSVPPPGARKL